MVQILFSDTKQEKTFLKLPFIEQIKKSVIFEGNQDCTQDEWNQKSDCRLDYIRNIHNLNKSETKQYLKKNLDLVGYPIKQHSNEEEKRKRITRENEPDIEFVDMIDILTENEEICYKNLVDFEGHSFIYDFDDICIKKERNDNFTVSLDSPIYIQMKEEMKDEYKKNPDPQYNHYVQQIWSDIGDYERIFSRKNTKTIKDRNWSLEHPTDIPEPLRGKTVTSTSNIEKEDNTYIGFLKSGHLEFIGVQKLGKRQYVDKNMDND